MPKRTRRPCQGWLWPPRFSALLPVLVAGALLTLAACGASPKEAPQNATEEALAATTEAGGASLPSARGGVAGAQARADTTSAAASHAAQEPEAGEITYRTYQNTKHGFSVRYPAGLLQPAGVVGNESGHTFRAADGSASMLTYATAEVTPEGVWQRFEEQTSNPDLDVTYQTGGEGWYVLSGYRGDNIFYERVEARDGTLKVVRLFYDRSQKTRFDPIVREVSNSLKG